MTLRLSVFIGPVLAAVAAATLLAPAAYAGVERLPLSGDPAYQINVPDGWLVTRDSENNMQIMAADHSGGIVVNMSEASDLPQANLDDVATTAFQVAHAQPYSRKEATILAGLPAQAYYSTADAGGGVIVNVRLVLAKVDGAHLASDTQVLRATATPAQVQAVESLQAEVRIVGRH